MFYEESYNGFLLGSPPQRRGFSHIRCLQPRGRTGRAEAARVASGARRRKMLRTAAAWLWFACVSAYAQGGAPTAAELFKEADLALGSKLIAEHGCTACHVRKGGGDGSAIYRPQGRINTPGFLRGMVEQCNTELRLSMFPEEVTSVAAVLNRDHYRFK